MTIELKLPNYTVAICNKLDVFGFKHRKVKDALIIELKQSQENNLIYKIPYYLSEYLFKGMCEVNVCEYESGGRDGENGQSTIICTTRGQKIKPLFYFKELRANNLHACFVLSKPFIKITAYCPGSKVLIECLAIEFFSDEIQISKKIYFEGDLDDVPDIFKEASFYAHLKACQIDCKEIVFAKID